jgi:hypothetical protein
MPTSSGQEVNMKPSLQLVALGALALPLAAGSAAWAQSARVENDYCHRLGAIYEHYLGRSYASPYNDYRRGPLSAQVAVTQCDSANPADAIAVLEDQLRRNGFSLPPRG